jgi:hypothetical protein
MENIVESIGLEISVNSEKSKLLKALSPTLVDVLKENGCYIAGGALTSIFSNKPISDYDIFFTGKESFVKVKEQIPHDYTLVNESPQALTYNCIKGTIPHKIQLIKLESTFKSSAEELIKTFDFTVCMAAYDCSSEKIIHSPDFLKHLAQRKLVYNKENDKPICTFFRLNKYKDKGYEVEVIEYIKIITRMLELNINSYESLANQLDSVKPAIFNKSVAEIRKQSGSFSFEKAFQILDSAYTEYVKGDKKDSFTIPF